MPMLQTGLLEGLMGLDIWFREDVARALRETSPEIRPSEGAGKGV